MTWTMADIARTAAGQAYLNTMQAPRPPGTPGAMTVAEMGLPPRGETLTLPWPPTTNHHTLGTGRGKRTLHPAWRAYRETVAGIVAAEWRGELCAQGAMSVALDYYPPDKRKRDIDNPIKAVLDALTLAGIWQDDRQVKELHCYWREARTPGHVRVTIERSHP